MADAPNHVLTRWGIPLFVIAHLVAITTLSLPTASSAMKRSAWKEPTVQRELQAWRARIEGLTGTPMTQEAFEDSLWTVADQWSKGRAAVLRPVRPYTKYFGTGQSWRMFLAPHTVPSRLQAEVQTPDGWVKVIGPDAEQPWNPLWVEHTRTRSTLFRLSWPHNNKAYTRIATWMARQILTEMPEATAVRFYWTKASSPTPEQVRSGNVPPSKDIRIRQYTREILE